MDYEPLPGGLALFAREEMRRVGVPGVAVGVVADGRWYAGGFGITSLANPLSVTPETIFQVGSTGKTFTATAVMLLADEGKLDVEERVRRYIPGFRLRSEEDAERVTIRDLLTHRGGWVGDYFKDMGPGDDALEQMTGKMADAPQVVPAGSAFSYSNAGFNVLARLVEVGSGQGFEAFVTERLIRPLGMASTTYWSQEAMLQRFAVGHVEGKRGLVQSDRWGIPRSIAGSSGVVATALDQLRWAAFHMGDGIATGGDRIIGAETLRAMQTAQAEAGSMCESMGWGWMLDTVGRERLVKHGGSIFGQLSSFEFVPAKGYGCTVLTNSESGREARDTIAAACLREFTGLERSLPDADPALSAKTGELVGRYSQRNADLEVAATAEGLLVQERQPAWLAAIEPREVDPPPSPVALFAPGRGVVIAGARRGETCEFGRGAARHVEWIRWDGRISRRAER